MFVEAKNSRGEKKIFTECANVHAYVYACMYVGGGRPRAHKYTNHICDSVYIAA